MRTVLADVYHYGARFDDRDVGDRTAIERAPAFGIDLTVKTDPRLRLAVVVATEVLRGDEGLNSYCWE